MSLVSSHSLERFLSVWLFCFAMPGAIAIGLYLNHVQHHWHWIVIAEFVYLLFVFWVISVIKFKVFRAYTRASLHLDAVRQEDFNQFAKSPFQSGRVKEFHQQLNQLSHSLLKQKSQYDQHMFLVYQLIAQLESPILVFNQKQQLTFANDAFSQLFNQHWQVLRHSTPDRLGLTIIDGSWQLSNSANKWQIKHSEFIDNGEKHLLLIFIDIESALRANQLKAWQQIIRVLSHEIRNSLTPVSSMAETLADRSLIAKDKKVLQVITERCQHLQEFVDRYSTISKKIELRRQNVSVAELEQALVKLFPSISLTFNHQLDTLWVDLTFFEQVLINLIKNSQEAGATSVTINCYEHEQLAIVEVIDDGHGFSNLSNLFIPLYTTKADGQGIGLSFCRNIIEQHNGVIELDNNTNKGVTVMLILPVENCAN